MSASGGPPITSGASPARGPLVSVVIPTFDEERELPGALGHLAVLPGRWEVLVADGGSRDQTVRIARERGARVVAEGGSRAEQINAAARHARGELLVFLHADSRLPPGAYAALSAAAREPGVVGGNFVLRFRGNDRFSFALTLTYAVHRFCRRYYGDSSLWVPREVFDRLGGFLPLPFMDDYDFVRRLEASGRTVCLPGPALTSSRRWRALGIPRTLFSWVVLRLMFRLGVRRPRLARLYERAR